MTAENTLYSRDSFAIETLRPPPEHYFIREAHVVAFLRNRNKKGKIMLVFKVFDQIMCAAFPIVEMCLCEYMNSWIINPIYEFVDVNDFCENNGYVLCIPHNPVPADFIRFLTNSKIAATTLCYPIVIIQELMRVFKNLDENNRHVEMSIKYFRDVHTFRSYLVNDLNQFLMNRNK